MATEITAITKITHDLLKLQQQQGTGELIVTPNPNETGIQWRLFFYMGRLIYATGGTHRVRRWYRCLQQHCPSLLNNHDFIRTQIAADPWEAHWLNLALNQGWITLSQAKAVIESSVQETMFGLIGYRYVTTEWHPGRTLPQTAAFLSTEQMLQEAQDLREQWRSSGLGYLQELLPEFSPDLAPIIRHPQDLATRVSASTCQVLTKLMKGKKTLWDVAAQMQRPLATLMRPLVPLIQQGLIELQEIADLPSPQPRQQRQAAIATKGLIACIDDSPVITQALETILAPAGYNVLSIHNPLQGFSQLLERKPDLIFLDLIMPNTNGYELCTFLRKTSAFQTTPIIILTGHDGVIDRVRAKMAGSSEFLSKPPEAEKVLQVVQKFLRSPEPTPSSMHLNLVMS